MKSLLLIFIFLSFSCEKNPDLGAKSNDQTKIAYKEDAKTFVISEFKLSASAKVYKMEGAPKVKVLRACVEEKLKEYNYFVEKGGNTVNLNITYDVLDEKSKSVVLLAEMQEAGSTRMFTAGTRIQSKGEGLEKMGEEACEDLVIRLTNSIKVHTSSDTELLTVISDTDSSASILKNAIQRIREKNIKTAAPKLVPLLKHEDANVAVAAAASLAKFQHLEARSGILTLAEDLSRNKNAAYIPMLYILADVGGAEINEYLKIISTSHDVPKVREVAQQAISNAKQKKAQK